MPSDKGKKARTPALSAPPGDGKTAFEAFTRHREAIPRDGVRTPNADVETCALFAMGVARKINEPAIHARFASLVAAGFDMAHVQDLGPLAQGAWYATIQLATASATSTEAKLPITLVNRATERKARMIKVVVHLFDDHPTLGLEIADIILGTGYRDLASDLIRLAKIYLDQHAIIERDPKHYRADDQAEALKDAKEIFTHLSDARSNAERMWADIVARAWTLLFQSYTEVAAAGNWLLRKEGGAEIFLPLVAAGRLGRGKAKKKGASEGGTGGGEGTGDQGGGAGREGGEEG